MGSIYHWGILAEDLANSSGLTGIDNLADILSYDNAMNLHQEVMQIPEPIFLHMPDIADDDFSNPLVHHPLEAFIARNAGNVDSASLETRPSSMVASIGLAVHHEPVLVPALSLVRHNLVWRIRQEAIESAGDDVVVLVNYDASMLGIAVMRAHAQRVGQRHEYLLFWPPLIALVSELGF